jgi:hypothetical protein
LDGIFWCLFEKIVKGFLSVLCFRLFVNIFVLKRENKMENKKEEEEALTLFMF